MRQKKLVSEHLAASERDAVDLIDLLEILWKEKILIIISALIFAGAAVYFVHTNDQAQYDTTMVLNPAPLNLYGEFVAEIENGKKQSITLGRYTAEQLLLLLNYRLADNKAQYFRDKDIVSFNVKFKSPDEITLQLSTLKNNQSVDDMQDYLDFASDILLEEVNLFLPEIGIKSTVTKEMLYSASEPITSQKELGEEVTKKDMIVSIGIIFGAMLGLFASIIIRSIIRKRKLLRLADIII